MWPGAAVAGIRGERHIVRNNALALPIRAMRGGPELAIQATSRYLAVERSLNAR